MKQSHVFDLYYVPTDDMINHIADIYKVAGQLNMTFNKLPSIAHDPFITECLMEELYHTNDLEGVQSTREEIAESVKDVHLKSNETKRFNCMIQSYMKVLEENTVGPMTAKQIRKIYDEITADEIAEKDLPDGEVCRKDKVDILRKSGSQKGVHRGLFPEEKIISEVEKMLRMMHEQKEISPLIKIAIGHYYFGYIHPFYEGNGRTSHFISSLFLSTTLGEIAALDLSRWSNSL